METLKKYSRIRKNKEDYEKTPEDVAFVFSGLLGESLVRENGFAGNAVHILAAFSDKEVQTPFCDVFELSKMQNLIPRLGIKTAILCVPHRQAAKFVEMLVQSGVSRIWNWSGNFLTSDNIDILNEELETELLNTSKE